LDTQSFNIAIAPNGSLYMSDLTKPGYLLITDSMGNVLQLYPPIPGEVIQPNFVYVDMNDNFYICDNMLNYCFKYSRNGTVLCQYGDGQPSLNALAAHPITNNIYIADIGSEKQINVYDNNGTYIRSFGSGGYPAGIAIDKYGKIYVLYDASSTPSLVEIYIIINNNETYIGQFGNGTLNIPSLIVYSIEPEQLLIIDTNVLEVFNLGGNFLFSIQLINQLTNNPFVSVNSKSGDIYVLQYATLTIYNSTGNFIMNITNANFTSCGVFTIFSDGNLVCGNSIDGSVLLYQIPSPNIQSSYVVTSSSKRPDILLAAILSSTLIPVIVFSGFIFIYYRRHTKGLKKNNEDIQLEIPEQIVVTSIPEQHLASEIII